MNEFSVSHEYTEKALPKITRIPLLGSRCVFQGCSYLALAWPGASSAYIHKWPGPRGRRGLPLASPQSCSLVTCTPWTFRKVRTDQRPEGLYPKSLPVFEQEPSSEVSGLSIDLIPCLSSEESPLDLTGKVYQLEVMLKQLHTDLQKVRPTVCLGALSSHPAPLLWNTITKDGGSQCVPQSVEHLSSMHKALGSEHCLSWA